MTEELITIGNEIQLYPEAVEIVEVNNLPRFPINGIMALGTAFEPISQIFTQVVNSGQSMSGIYKVTLPKGATHLATLKSGAGNIGAAMNANNQLVGQAILNPVAMNPAAMSPVVMNPALIFMAITLANIDNKLNTISELQKEMMQFMVQEKKSELKGNLDFLKDLLRDFKYNWNNEQFKKTAHNKVLDTKQESYKQIDFYSGQIKTMIRKKDLFHSEQDAKKEIDKIRDALKDLQISQYLYGYSSFVEILLSGNYGENYLNSITERIEKNSFKYRELYSKAYDYLQNYVNTSIEGQVLGGIASLSKGVGKVVEQLPLINQTQLDESLQKTGEHIEEKRDLSIDKSLGVLVTHQSSPTKEFVDAIKIMNLLHNKSSEILFDKDFMYLGGAVN